jgi:hypothetical protein
MARIRSVDESDRNMARFDDVDGHPLSFASPRRNWQSILMIAYVRAGKLRLPFTAAYLMRRPTWWRMTVADRHWLLAAAATISATLGLGAYAHYWQSTATSDIAHLLAAARDRSDAARRESQQAHARAAASQPWWAQLSSTAADAGNRPTARTDPEQLSADALALAPKLNVQVQRLTFAPPLQVSGAPYRSTAVQVEVQGPYADIKRWLSELVARRPHTLAVKSTDWRRGGGANAGAVATDTNFVDATIELRLFEQSVTH